MAKKEKRLKILGIQYMSLFFGLAVFVLIAYLSLGGSFTFFTSLEQGMLDQSFRWKEQSLSETRLKEGVIVNEQENPKLSRDIVIVGADEDSLKELGRWPWPRSVQSRVLQSTARVRFPENRERAVFVDIFYNEPDLKREEDDFLYNSIRENGRVFLETIPGLELKESQEARSQTYALQDNLYRRYGTLVDVKGPWRKVDPYMDDQVPLARLASAMKGFGNAIHIIDKDEICRNALLVVRFSRLIEETDIPIMNGGFRAALKNISFDGSQFEWIAWKDKHNQFHPIEAAALKDEAALAKLEQEMAANALRDSDQDGGKEIYRIRRFRDHFLPSIVMSLAMEYYHKKPSDIEVKYGDYIRIPDPEVYVLDNTDRQNPKGEWQKLVRDNRTVTELRIPIDSQGFMRINFMGPSSATASVPTFTLRPFYQVADPSSLPAAGSPKASWPIARGLANKIAIVCAFATGIGDEKATPFGLMYGGEIHANALNTILMQNYLYTPPDWLTLAIIFIAVMFTAFMSARLPPLLSLVVSLWLILIYQVYRLFLFDGQNVILNFSGPSVGILFTFLLVVAYRVIFEEQDKRRIKGMFSKYVNPQVVEQLLVSPPELGGVDKEISVLFSDIRGYTTFSETLSPQALVNHLNIYLTAMTDILIQYLGTLDKYVGDMVMGFWGAPLPQKNHALLACQCALKQMEVLRTMNASWPPEKRIDIGIGINSGIMTVGNMGSPARMNYTLIGDNVNLGSRLEGTNKNYGTNIIISEYTYGLVKDQVTVRELDNIRVKGKNKPVLIYELIDVVGGLEPPKESQSE